MRGKNTRGSAVIRRTTNRYVSYHRLSSYNQDPILRQRWQRQERAYKSATHEDLHRSRLFSTRLYHRRYSGVPVVKIFDGW